MDFAECDVPSYPRHWPVSNMMIGAFVVAFLYLAREILVPWRRC
jgi:hypothetical protein